MIQGLTLKVKAETGRTASYESTYAFDSESQVVYS